ncbi:MAG: acetyl-CoA carboxylase carboxyltransferase subunit alpha [Lachnospiraceae bacterium]|nr:acetyl-CoA carboxylase carboxyltransferase subunit alpha [Lachnospiraceae bacterium]
MIRQILEQTENIEKKLAELEQQAAKEVAGLSQEGISPVASRRGERKYKNQSTQIIHLKALRHDLLQQCRNLTPEDKVYLARYATRPHVEDFIDALFTDFFEQKGDHLYDEDQSIYGGIALYKKTPVTIIGHRKGHTAEENVRYNFGMPCPEGYRKALRLMQQAEKFHRPIITFVDTPGAYPGMEAEEHGQGEAIARNLAAMSHLSVPVITIVTGEGNSGGALALSVANRMLMLENAVYSVLSPEGFASILWKDASRRGEACSMMKLTADDLFEAGIIDEIIPEPAGGAQTNPSLLYHTLDEVLERHFKQLQKMNANELVADRHQKFRKIG